MSELYNLITNAMYETALKVALKNWSVEKYSPLIIKNSSININLINGKFPEEISKIKDILVDDYMIICPSRRIREELIDEKTSISGLDINRDGNKVSFSKDGNDIIAMYSLDKPEVNYIGCKINEKSASIASRLVLTYLWSKTDKSIINELKEKYHLLDESFKFSNERVVELSLNKYGLESIDDITKLIRLERLYLNGNNIKSLPDDIKYLKGLKLLDISDNEITSIPDSVKDLKINELIISPDHDNLNFVNKFDSDTKVIVKNNNLILPLNEFNFLMNITNNSYTAHLIINNHLNSIKTIHGVIRLKQQSTLKSNQYTLTDYISDINLDDCDLSGSLDGIYSLDNLKELKLTNANITKLPNLDELKIESVNLSGNKISDLNDFPSLDYLNSLDLSNNNLTGVVKLPLLKSLKSLRIDYNEIHGLKVNLPVIESIMLGSKIKNSNFMIDKDFNHTLNCVVDLQEIDSLIKLKNDNLSPSSKNFDSSVFNELGSLKSVSICNSFFDFSNLLSLKNLEFLQIVNCQLNELPEEVIELKNLKTLVLAYNNFNHLPESIVDLKSLERLIVIEKDVVKLPNTITMMKNLKEFSCMVHRDQLSSVRKLKNNGTVYIIYPDDLKGLKQSLFYFSSNVEPDKRFKCRVV
ncbi:MAG TPA: leucine-rich repeat domain-containing protein [Candidatus Nanoarchaeia archaeon]|nr:leucine-rich repeat domain-containing protein [Candidatus Nanoarchaeia archaeon]